LDLALIAGEDKAMLRISVLDTPIQRRLVIEGKLIGPWAALLRSVWWKATAGLNGRELVIDVEGLTAITKTEKTYSWR
jgi:hypothetical protein